ncbi:MAG: glycosyltransferase family 39 protein [Patescibacteria group bacterium]
MFKFIKNNYPLILIIILGLFLRFWGVFFDWPLSSSVGDEIKIISGSLKMLGDFNFLPHSNYGTYFPLMYYLYLPGIIAYAAFLFVSGQAHDILDIKNSVILDLGNWLMIARFISVLLGVGSVYLIYLISKKIFNNKAISYGAALFLALSPFNVVLSHFGRPWGPQVFFILLALYFFLRFWKIPAQPPSIKIIFFTAVLILSSFAVNIVGALAYPLWLLVVFVYYCELKWRRFFVFLKSRQSILSHLFLIIGVVIIFWISRDALKVYNVAWGIYFTAISGEAVQEVSPVWQLPWWGKTGLQFNILIQFETVVFFLLVPALWLLYKNNKPNFYFTLLSFLGFFVALGPPLMDSSRPRYLSLLIPFMILPAAYLAGNLLERIRKNNFFFALLVIVIFMAPNLFINLKYDYLLSRGSTKLSLYSWIKNNLKPGEKILMVDGYFLQDLAPDKQLMALIKQYSPGYYSSRLTFLDNMPFAPGQSYGIYSNGFVCEWPKEVIERLEFDYVAIVDAGIGSIPSLNYFKICDSIPVYKLAESQLVFSEKTAPFYNYRFGRGITIEPYVHYSIESGLTIESYVPLWQIKKLGKQLSIYKVSP